LIELFRTSTFRLALIYFGLFAASVTTVLGLIYYQTVIYTDQQTDETIDAEIRGLGEQYQQRGLSGLITVINERIDDPSRGPSSMLYLLTDQNGRTLAGNISGWPDATVGPDGWMRFALNPEASGAHRHQAQATSFRLRPGSYQLLVGRDLAERMAFQNGIIEALSRGLALTLALGLCGGLMMSRGVLARIETINRASDRVMAGEFGRRIPVRGTNDEFDRLAGNLNLMLDRIERLMDGMRQVTDNIAHDLRSPLGRLRSRIEVALIAEGEGAEYYREVLRQTTEEADHLLATFNALLDIAEAEAGSPRAEMSDVNLVELVGDLVELYQPSAEEKGLALVSDLPSFRLDMRGNRHLLSRALANLVENAIKYTPAPGRIGIALTPVDGGARLVVADSGPGIPTDSRDRVFDRFYRLEASRTTPGNGLGLSLARAVIRLHGGAVVLADNAPGLKAIVTLPLLSAPGTLEAPAPRRRLLGTVTPKPEDGTAPDRSPPDRSTVPG
jgi:signal transduction histidine kinase